jgi:hypothetical protein
MPVRAQLRASVAWRSGPAVRPRLRTAHHSHTPEITFESPTKASGIWATNGVSMWDQGDEEHWFVAFGHHFETSIECSRPNTSEAQG